MPFDDLYEMDHGELARKAGVLRWRVEQAEETADRLADRLREVEKAARRMPRPLANGNMALVPDGPLELLWAALDALRPKEGESG